MAIIVIAVATCKQEGCIHVNEKRFYPELNMALIVIAVATCKQERLHSNV